MTCTEFETKLTTLYQTLFDKELVVNSEPDKYWLNSFTPFVAAIEDKDFPFFLFVEEVGDTIEFCINIRQRDLFQVKKDEINSTEDFIPQIKIKDEWKPYEFEFSTLLLTEYVDWLWNQVPNKLEMQIGSYGLYVPIKKYWNQFFNPFSYPNKIWVGKEMRSVILIQNESNLLKCLAKDKVTLNIAQKILEI
ncbi:MAG: hypothetical protein BGO31_11015 [Bacteroidetes bacterium 43-16]|uniref:hypothetical protein n=1 Tax=uncultured Dysgonomonas sp. TaxID=206096 RepID=UPI00092AF484|nr:hypothetical protein [uncultured Dysgonomonas sp.]OJV50990.1 MAG: hypothetical protein BGO31_11015 [Bacteroidetes bacterium 43-16]